MIRFPRSLVYGFGIFVPFVVFFYMYLVRGYERVPKVSNFHADLSEIRALAGRGPGLARSIRSIKVGDGSFPDWVLVAGGTDVDEYPSSWRAFQVVYPDKTILIDPVHDRELHEGFPLGGDYDDAAFDRMQDWVRDADLILATHDHWDHVGGIAASPHLDQIHDKVLFTAEQMGSHWLDDVKFPPEFLEKLEPLSYDKLHKVAPGMVLIKAPGHTIGTQMIYLRLQSGQEVIFVGDVIWNRVNLERLRGHNRFVGLSGEEDLEAKAHQIRWLHDIWKAGEVKLIVAHDQNQHIEFIGQGLFTDD